MILREQILLAKRTVDHACTLCFVDVSGGRVRVRDDPRQTLITGLRQVHDVAGPTRRPAGPEARVRVVGRLDAILPRPALRRPALRRPPALFPQVRKFARIGRLELLLPDAPEELYRLQIKQRGPICLNPIEQQKALQAHVTGLHGPGFLALREP